MAASKVHLSQMTPEELKELFGLSELPASPDDFDPKKLPDETQDAFSYDGLEFEEAANQLWKHLTLMNYHAGTYNRHSEWFPIACAQLEKDIRMMGSFCLAKAVLEQKGQSFPSLQGMSIKTLYGLTSYYFRKCGKAFDEIYDKAGLISLQMHRWELRWYTLGERLKATQEKINNILSGKIKVDSLLKRTEMYKSEKSQDAQQDDSQKSAIEEEKPLQIWQNALPMIGSYAHQITQERKEEEHIRYINKKIARMKEQSERYWAKEEAEEKREKEKASAASQKSQGQAAETPASEEKAPQKPQRQEIGETGMTIPELRVDLLKKAEQREEGDQIMQIAGDPPNLLLERWERYRQEDEKLRPAVGSSGHNRKKRKKR